MLRLLDKNRTAGYVFDSDRGPACELVHGVVRDITENGYGYTVTLIGTENQNGVAVEATLPILFENRGSGRKLLATRVTASRMKPGMYVSALCMIRNREHVVLDFKFKGLWRLKGYKGEMNILTGFPAQTIHTRDGKLGVLFLDSNTSGSRKFQRYAVFDKPDILPQARNAFEGHTGKNSLRTVCLCGPEYKKEDCSLYRCKAFECYRF